MNSSWWASVDTNAKNLISFQILLIAGLTLTNFFLFFIIEKNNYAVYFSVPQMFGSPRHINNPVNNIVHYPVDRPQ